MIPRYRPFHPWLCLISFNESHMCVPKWPEAFFVVTWNLILSKSSGFIHSVVTMPAPSPAAAWSCQTFFWDDILFFVWRRWMTYKCSSWKETCWLAIHSQRRLAVVANFAMSNVEIGTLNVLKLLKLWYFSTCVQIFRMTGIKKI